MIELFPGSCPTRALACLCALPSMKKNISIKTVFEIDRGHKKNKSLNSDRILDFGASRCQTASSAVERPQFMKTRLCMDFARCCLYTF